MEELIIHCRKVVGGKASGPALVSYENIGCFGSLDESTGVITERGHGLHGVCIKDQIFLFPAAKGSSGWSGTFHMLKVNRVAPKAMLIVTIDAKSALGAVLCNCPTVSDFDQDPFSVIHTGDWVEVDADNGIVVVKSKSKGDGNGVSY